MTDLSLPLPTLLATAAGPALHPMGLATKFWIVGAAVSGLLSVGSAFFAVRAPRSGRALMGWWLGSGMACWAGGVGLFLLLCNLGQGVDGSLGVAVALLLLAGVIGWLDGSRWRVQVAGLTGCLLLVLLPAEVGTRVWLETTTTYSEAADWWPGPLQYVYRPLANFRCRHINAQGLISPVDTPEEKAPGTFRIALIGDSLTHWCDDCRCEGGDSVEIFPVRLQEELRGRFPGRPIEVLNFGVVGYNSLQEAAALRLRALRFHPDLVLASVCFNDGYARPLLTLKGTRYGHLQFLERLLRRMEIIPEVDESYEVDPEGIIARGLSEMGRTCDRAGVPLRFVIWPYMPLGSGARIDAALLAIVRAQGRPSLAMAPIFAEVPLDRLVVTPQDHSHFGAAGHHAAGKALAEWLSAAIPAR